MQHDVIVQSVKQGQEICDVIVSFFGSFWSHSGGAGGQFIFDEPPHCNMQNCDT